MGLVLNAPQAAAMPMPPPRLTSYRYWEDYAPHFLHAIHDTVRRVLDDKERQRDLFEEAPAAAPETTETRQSADNQPTVPAPSAPAVKNETLGNLLSPSQANQFLNCSARWWFRYGAGLPDPKSGSLVRGTAVHKCIEHYFKLQLSGAAPGLADLAEFYEDAWEAGAADAQFSQADNIEDLKKSGARLLRLYLDEVAPQIHPVQLEQKVTGEIGGVRVQGYIDQVDATGRILDVKTAEKSPSGIGSDYAFQLATYRQILPGASGKARLDTLVNNKTPKLVTIEYEVSVRDQLMTVALYPRVREGIREGLYFPNRNSNLCSRKYCNFCDACTREFGGTVD